MYEKEGLLFILQVDQFLTNTRFGSIIGLKVLNFS